MPVILVPKHVVLSSSNVPELNDFIDPNVWLRFTNSIRAADEQGTCLACAVEWGICCLTGLWCVFCCHACIADGFNESKWRQECTSVNHAYYQGRPVFTVGANFSVVVNTDNVGGMIAAPPAPVYAAAPQPYGAPQMAYPAQPAYGAPQAAYPQQPAPMAQAVPVAAGPRFVNVVVPGGVVAGSVLTVTTPDNTMLSVTVPPGLQPGQEFKVQY